MKLEAALADCRVTGRSVTGFATSNDGGKGTPGLPQEVSSAATKRQRPDCDFAKRIRCGTEYQTGLHKMDGRGRPVSSPLKDLVEYLTNSLPGQSTWSEHTWHRR